MKHMFEDGKAIIINGKPGSGKTSLASAIALSCGSYRTVAAIELKDPFKIGHTLCATPNTVIVEECTQEVINSDYVKHLITDRHVKAERKGKEPVVMQSPNFIFVGNGGDLKLDIDARRFMVINCEY